MKTKPTYEELEKELEILRRNGRAITDIEFSGILFVEIDTKGIVVSANKAACEILGYKEKEILGENWFGKFISNQIKVDVLQIADKGLTG